MSMSVSMFPGAIRRVCNPSFPNVSLYGAVPQRRKLTSLFTHIATVYQQPDALLYEKYEPASQSSDLASKVSVAIPSSDKTDEKSIPLVKSRFFERKKEMEQFSHVLKAAPQISVVSGPRNSGKTTLLLQALGELSQEKGRGPILYVGLGGIPFNGLAELVPALESHLNPWENRLVKWLKDGGSPSEDRIAQCLARARGLLPPSAPVERNDDTPQKRLQNVLSKISYTLSGNSQQGLSPILFIDEANRLLQLLEDKDGAGRGCLKSLFEWFITHTKQNENFHVVLGATDSFFRRQLQERCLIPNGCFVNYTVGNLTEQEAQRFWNEQLSADPKSFEQAYSVCGGSPHYLRKYRDESQRSPGLTPEEFSVARQEYARLIDLYNKYDGKKVSTSVPKGLIGMGELPWNKPEFFHLMRILANNKNGGCMRYVDLCEQMEVFCRTGEDRRPGVGQQLVDAWIQRNVLHLGAPTEYVNDVTTPSAETIGDFVTPAAETIGDFVTPESAATLFAMKKMLGRPPKKPQVSG